MKFNLPVVILLLTLISYGCSKSGNTNVKPVVKDSTVVVPDNIPMATYDLSLLDRCLLFNDAPAVAAMQRQDYEELSGVAESHATPGVLYVHEDKPGKNMVYLTNKQGDDLGRIVLDGCLPTDWEDIAVGPGPDASKSYVYVADIGDNNAIHPSVSIYRFAEPPLTGATVATEVHVTADRIEINYTKGAANAETLMIDPLTRDLFIATKESLKSYVYIIPYPQSTTTITTVKPLAQLSFDFLTSGDISPNGQEILLRNKSQIWYWKRNPAEDIPTTLLHKPQDAPYAANEHQGEGVGFAADGSGYYTDSEIRDYPGAIATISFYKRK